MSEQKAQIIWRTSEKGKRITGQRKVASEMSYWKETGPVVRRFTTWLLKGPDHRTWRLFTEW